MVERRVNPRQAIHILMLSPCYWLLNLAARKTLVQEYCTTYMSCLSRQSGIQTGESTPLMSRKETSR